MTRSENLRSLLAFNLAENCSNGVYDYPSVCAFIPTLNAKSGLARQKRASGRTRIVKNLTRIVQKVIARGETRESRKAKRPITLSAFEDLCPVITCQAEAVEVMAVVDAVVAMVAVDAVVEEATHIRVIMPPTVKDFAVLSDTVYSTMEQEELQIT